MGIIGLIGLLTMLVSIILYGLKAMRRLAWGERSELMIGLLATLIVSGAHIAFEWLFMTNYVHYLLAMSTGALVGITATLNRKSGSRFVQRHPTVETDFASQPG